MYIVTEPLTENDVLAATSENATGERIKEDMENKAQCCVDHLCGCR